MIYPNPEDDELDQDEFDPDDESDQDEADYPDRSYSNRYEYDYPNEDDFDDEPRPLWTRNRLLLIIVVLIMIITLLAYMLQGLFIPPAPPPTLAPGSLI